MSISFLEMKKLRGFWRLVEIILVCLSTVHMRAAVKCMCVSVTGKRVGVRFVNILGGKKKFCFWWGDAEIGWGRGKIGGLLRSHCRHQHRWFDHSFSNYTE